MRHRSRLAIAAIVLFVVGIIALGVCAHRDTAPEGAPVPPVLKLEDGGLLLTFHVPTCEYGLFDKAADPKLLTNLRDARPEDFRRLKDEFRERVKKQYEGAEPEDLRNRPDVVDRLRGHPYF
jgi:hypothetical protein